MRIRNPDQKRGIIFSVIENKIRINNFSFTRVLFIYEKANRMRMYNSQFGMECLVDALENTTLSEHPVSKPLLVGHFRDHAAD